MKLITKWDFLRQHRIYITSWPFEEGKRSGYSSNREVISRIVIVWIVDFITNKGGWNCLSMTFEAKLFARISRTLHLRVYWIAYFKRTTISLNDSLRFLQRFKSQQHPLVFVKHSPFFWKNLHGTLRNHCIKFLLD